MSLKSTIFYFDVQNLFRTAKACFNKDTVTHPNFDPVKLANWVCARQHLKLKNIKFYTGVPPKSRDPLWHHFWSKKIASLNRNSLVETFVRTTRSRPVKCETCLEEKNATVEVEKGIDVRIAIDIVRDAIDKESEAIVIFSQDRDLLEATKEAKKIARSQKRQLDMYSVFPASHIPSRRGGLSNTKWIFLTEKDYKGCIDPADYREILRK